MERTSRREIGRSSPYTVGDDEGTPRRKRDQAALPDPLPVPAATKRAGSLPPILLAPAQSPDDRGEIVPLRSMTGSAHTHGRSPGAAHATFEEMQREAMWMAYQQMESTIHKNKAVMAEKYASEFEGWKVASEEFKAEAREVTNLEVAKKVMDAEMKVERHARAEANERERIHQLNITKFAQ